MEFTREGLQQLMAAGVSEHDRLEFKAAGAIGTDVSQKTKITIAVSAFANADGGTVIFGIKETNLEPRRAEFDPIDTKRFNKEWLEQVLGLIRDPILGLKITEVPVGEDPTQVCFVVTIPKGKSAHQALDKKYYRRRNFMVEAMAHYEVVECLQRSQVPKIGARVFLREGEAGFIHLHVSNLSTLVARNFKVQFFLPRAAQLADGKVFCAGMVHGNQRYSEVEFRRLKAGRLEFIGGPLFPKDVAEFGITLLAAAPTNRPRPEGSLQHIVVRVYADNMHPPFVHQYTIEECFERWSDGNPFQPPDEF